MKELGEEQGCGRAMWEHEEQHDRYGTPMALMLLPYWTDGCIGSMEGLYFEASATTPYHFLNQDELSTAPSNAQRDLPYGPGAPTKSEFDTGVRHLQMLGVKYYMAISTPMIDLGRTNPNLTEVASSGPWVVFQVADSELVTPLTAEPAVVEGASAGGTTWLDDTVSWYMDPQRWDVPLAASGPPEWQRIQPGDIPATRPVGTTAVSNVSTGTDTISFDVTQVGVPVLVKASYFPNWKVSGADGPYRVSPNLMVVIPTSNHVSLHYGWTGVDLLAWGLTLLGMIGVVWLVRARPVVMPEPPDCGCPSTRAARTTSMTTPVTPPGGSTGRPAGRGPDRRGSPARGRRSRRAPVRPGHGDPRSRGRRAGRGRAGVASRTGWGSRAAPRGAPGRGAVVISRRRRLMRVTGLALLGAALVSLLRDRRVAHVRVRFDLEHRVPRPPSPGTYRLTVVVPAYREGERIAETVRRLRKDLAVLDPADRWRTHGPTGPGRIRWRLEIVVVDDGSDDGTALEARAAGADQVIVLPGEPGQGRGGAGRHAGRPRPDGGVHRRRSLLRPRPPPRPARRRSRPAGTWWWAAAATTTPPRWCGPGGCGRSGGGPSTC